jgi:hypothetical protein
MPKESATPLNRGTGSTSQDFTAPSVGVSTPGRQLQAPTTEAEAFRDAMLTFGRGVASAVSARSQINQRIKSLKETSMRKVEADLNRSARSFQNQRLERADKERRSLIAESGEKGPEWLERQLRARMANAPSAQEANIWEGAWTRANAAVDRSNGEAKQQSFNQAKMTMTEVAIGLTEELAEKPALQQTLIGDGTGISGRTQDWMLQQVQRDVDMDKLAPEDAEFLIHQTVVQASRIADGLRSKHTKATEDSNQKLGARQMEADLFSTMTGEQEPSRIRDQIETTLRDRFNHLTLEQQDDFVKQTIAGNLQKLASGDFGLDNFESLESARELINLTINGRKVYDDAERAQLETAMRKQAAATISTEMETQLTTEREKFNTVITLPDGNQITRADLNADAKLITADPDTGLSPLDHIADRVIDQIGTDDPFLIAEVRAIQTRLVAGAGRTAAKTNADWLTAVNVLQGGRVENPASEGNLAHNLAPESKAMRTPLELASSKRAGLTDQEDRHLRDSYRQIAIMTGQDPAAVDSWNGETIGTDHPLRAVADVAQATLWNNPDVVANTGMPPALVRDKVSLLTSDDAGDFASFGRFATTLNGGAGGAWQKFLASDMSDSERAAAIHARTTMMRGRAQFNKDGEPVIQNPGEEATDMNFLHSQVQQLQGVPNRKGWIWARPDGAGTPSNMERIATYWADAMQADDDPRMYSETDWDANNEALSLAMTKAVSQDTALADWLNATMQSQSALDSNLDEGQVAALALGWMERDGLRVKQTGNDNAIILRDPANHTGPAGGNLEEHAAAKLTTPYPPWARDVIQRALGAAPFEAPETLQGLYLFGRKGTVTGNQILPDASRPLTLEDARVSGLLVAEYGNTPGDNQRRLDNRGVMGGAVLHATTSDGERLQLPVATHRVEFTYPDGTPGVIEEGQILSIVNIDFTPSPAPKQRVRNGGYVQQSNVTSSFSPRLSGMSSNASVNTPRP